MVALHYLSELSQFYYRAPCFNKKCIDISGRHGTKTAGCAVPCGDILDYINDRCFSHLGEMYEVD